MSHPVTGFFLYFSTMLMNNKKSLKIAQGINTRFKLSEYGRCPDANGYFYDLFFILIGPVTYIYEMFVVFFSLSGSLLLH